MNHQASSPAQGLFETLARRWALPSAVDSLCFSGNGETLALARRDGGLSFAAVHDPEPPDTRLHVAADTGRATIQMRKLRPGTLATSEALSRTRPQLVADGPSHFLVGTAEGRLRRIGADGVAIGADIALPGPISALAQATGTGLLACAAADRLYLRADHGAFSEGPQEMPPHITTLAFSPDGAHLAIGCPEQVVILDLAAQQLHRIILPGTPVDLRWRADGRALAAALGPAGIALIDLTHGVSTIFADFPTPVLQLDWSAPAAALLAAGAFRIAAWSASGPLPQGSQDGVLITGRAGLVPVQCLAAHPEKPMAAAGYVNGQVVVAPIGQAEELVVKPVGAPITAIGWSAEGQLAICDAEGLLALLSFPRRLFK